MTLNGMEGFSERMLQWRRMAILSHLKLQNWNNIFPSPCADSQRFQSKRKMNTYFFCSNQSWNEAIVFLCP